MFFFIKKDLKNVKVKRAKLEMERFSCPNSQPQYGGGGGGPFLSFTWTCREGLYFYIFRAKFMPRHQADQSRQGYLNFLP